MRVTSNLSKKNKINSWTTVKNVFLYVFKNHIIISSFVSSSKSLAQIWVYSQGVLFTGMGCIGRKNENAKEKEKQSLS